MRSSHWSLMIFRDWSLWCFSVQDLKRWDIMMTWRRQVLTRCLTRVSHCIAQKRFSSSISNSSTFYCLIEQLATRRKFHYNTDFTSFTLRWSIRRQMIVTSLQSILWTYFWIIYKSYFENQSRITDWVSFRIMTFSLMKIKDDRKQSNFLLALMSHKIVFNLRSKIENEDLTFELFSFFKRVRTDNFNYEHYRSLSQLVIKKTFDVNIWEIVFELIITISQTISFTSIFVFFDNILITSLFVSQQDDEQTRKLVKAKIFENIKKCTYQNVEEFFFKYFEKKDWTEQIKKIYRVVQDRHVNDKLIDFLDSSIQNAILEWLFRFQEKFLIDSRNVYYTSKNNNNFTDVEIRRQVDVFVKFNDKNISKTIHDCKNVEMINEFKKFDKK